MSIPHKMISKIPTSRFAGTACAILIVISATLPRFTEAQVSGISYTLSPTGKYIFFSDDAGLKDGLMYGGELGFGFGKFLELNGTYVLGNGFETDYTNFGGDVFTSDVLLPADAVSALSGLPIRKMDLVRYGGKVRINIGSGRFIPFITAGTGIQEFKGEGVASSEQIYSNLGVGLTFSVAERYTLSVGAENLTYRYNPASTLLSESDLTAVGLTRESFNLVTVNNPVLSTSLKIFLGGRSDNGLTETDRAMLRQLNGGGFRLAVEPFYGQIDFNEALGFPKSTAVAGVNAGFDLGPYIGIRGFYWVDTEQETAFDGGVPKGFGKLKMYGGELDLRFGNGGITPYLIVGAGYLNGEKSDLFANADGIVAESRYFATGGAGLEVPITSGIKLQGGVRGLFMSTEDIADVNGPSSVFGSLMYTGGINFSIGRKARKSTSTVKEREIKPIPAGEMEVEVTVDENGEVVTEVITVTPKDARVLELEAELKKMQSRLDSLQTLPAHSMPHHMDKVIEVDSVVVKGAKSNISDRTMTIPVPEVGEIYIRFGATEGRIRVDSSMVRPVAIDSSFKQVLDGKPVVEGKPVAYPVVVDSMGVPVPGAVAPEAIQDIVKQVLSEQSKAANAEGGVTAEQLEKSLSQMEERLDKRIAAEVSKVQVAAREPEVEVMPATVADSSKSDATGLVALWQDRHLDSVLPQIGLGLKDGIDAVILGARADYRFPDQKVRFMPEAAFVIGEAVGISALANFAWYPYELGKNASFYTGVGAGLVSEKFLSGLEMKLNLFVGIEYEAKTGTTFFGEFSTLDFFDYNRFMFGYRIKLNK